MTPTLGGGAGLLPVLSFVLPVTCAVIVAISIPAVRALISARSQGVREYFYGPAETDLQAVSDGPQEAVRTETGPVPSWFDLDIFTEDTASDED
jgi:hypothetical protein